MKLEKFEIITGKIECLTGLRIGGTKDTIGIGEMDNPIIRNPVNRLPYIPGSSLKGKMRSLLELKYSPVSQKNGIPCTCGMCDICLLFGCGSTKETREPGRLIFRDCPLNEDSRQILDEALPGTYAEVKTEVVMDRLKATVSDKGGPRPVERVPEGTVFDLSLTMRIFADDDPEKRKDFLNKLAEGFEMLEQDYLGGSGTRGYGKVKITHGDQSMADYLRELKL